MAEQKMPGHEGSGENADQPRIRQV
jgi:hypothetical protein